jgi:hypothetical protein
MVKAGRLVKIRRLVKVKRLVKAGRLEWKVPRRRRDKRHP